MYEPGKQIFISLWSHSTYRKKNLIIFVIFLCQGITHVKYKLLQYYILRRYNIFIKGQHATPEKTIWTLKMFTTADM